MRGQRREHSRPVTPGDELAQREAGDVQRGNRHSLTRGCRGTALDVSGLSLRELISRCHRAGMLAALSAHCHPEELTTMLHERFGKEGAEARLACVVNLNLPGTVDTVEYDGARVTRATAEELPESRIELCQRNFQWRPRGSASAARRSCCVELLRHFESRHHGAFSRRDR